MGCNPEGRRRLGREGEERYPRGALRRRRNSYLDRDICQGIRKRFYPYKPSVQVIIIH